MSITADTEVDRVREELKALAYQPLAWVMWAFPWGQAGTALENEVGPDVWQISVLNYFGKALRDQQSANSALKEAIQLSVASGHGPGKSALCVWIIMFFISTRDRPQIVVTANTKTQLETKTWRELSKWHGLFRLKKWFRRTATRYYCNFVDTDDWFATAVPWTVQKSEAFAGTHAEHVLMVYDEASGIDDVIWEVTEGAMMTGNCVWVAFGNPTKNTGRFRECFRDLGHRWKTWQVDSRDAKKTNKLYLQNLVDDHGEDSDIVRVRVRGMFPRRGANQLIDDETVRLAKKREALGYEHMPIVFGVDVARFGDDESVVYVRQGTATLEIKKYQLLDSTQFAGIVSSMIIKHRPEQVFVDAVGYGSGVVDALRNLGYNRLVVSCNGATTPNDPMLKNKRMEMWNEMAIWLKEGGCIPKGDEIFHKELISAEYFFDRSERMVLESKQDMKARGLLSPNTADALALTFYLPVNATRRRGSVPDGVIPEFLGSHMAR